MGIMVLLHLDPADSDATNIILKVKYIPHSQSFDTLHLSKAHCSRVV